MFVMCFDMKFFDFMTTLFAESRKKLIDSLHVNRWVVCLLFKYIAFCFVDLVTFFSFFFSARKKELPHVICINAPNI